MPPQCHKFFGKDNHPSHFPTSFQMEVIYFILFYLTVYKISYLILNFLLKKKKEKAKLFKNKEISHAVIFLTTSKLTSTFINFIACCTH
jgi:hypothetical protein